MFDRYEMLYRYNCCFTSNVSEFMVQRKVKDKNFLVKV